LPVVHNEPSFGQQGGIMIGLRASLVAVLAAALLPAAAIVAAQSPRATTPAIPRTPDGRPDLQGFWDFRTLTPLERPKSLGDKALLTEAEARALQQQNSERRERASAQTEPRETPRTPGGGGQAVGAYNDFWVDSGVTVVGDRRTSLIVEPADGRVPATIPGAPRQMGSLMEDMNVQPPIRVLATGARADGPEHRGLSERCLVGFNSGPPMVPSGYNNHLQIVQTPQYVAILNEMNHDVRIVPLDGRAPLASSLRQWAGVSRGRWDGDTLVVTTTNFTDKTASFNPSVAAAYGTGAALTLTERFRRTDAATLLYEFTVEDPNTFTRPFSAQVPMQKSDQPVFEYACHEGNSGLMNILRGARSEESERP
jgi:hypothetical protein